MSTLYSLQWITSELPGSCMEVCVKALTQAGAEIDERMRESIRFHLVSTRGAVENGQISVIASGDNTRIELLIAGGARDAAINAFLANIQMLLPSLLKEKYPTPLWDIPERSIFISYRRSDAPISSAGSTTDW